MFYKIPKYFLAALMISVLIRADNHNFTFRQLKVEDGLSQSTILSIVQDRKGYIWFGTGNGLNKYNGYSFIVYSNIIDDNTSISSNAVTSIFEDSKGNLWIGTVDGVLNLYNRPTDTFTRYYVTSGLDDIEESGDDHYDYPVSFSRNNNNSLTTIAEDDKGVLWLGTWGKGIIRFNPLSGRLKHFHKSNGHLAHNKVTRILKDSDGTLWIGTMGGGLNYLKNPSAEAQFKTYLHNPQDPKSISDNKIISIFEDAEKNIWIGTYNHGLNKLSFDNRNDTQPVFENFRNIPGQNSLAGNTVMSVIQDKAGHIWIGTFGGGLDRYDPKTNSFLNFKKNSLDENSIADNDVLTIFEDRSGIIWIGTHLGSGISKLERNKIKFNILKNSAGNSLNDDVVWSIFKDQSKLYIGTYRGGLNVKDKKGQFAYFKNDPSNPNSISDNHIRAIVKGFNGEFWLGTYSGGLNRFSPASGKFISYKNDPNDSASIGANQVLSITTAPDSIIWLGTFGGGLNSFRYSPEPGKISFKRYVNSPSDPSTISDNRVYSVFRTKDGVIWAGTFGGGLNKLDAASGKFTRYLNNPDDPSTISHNRVMAVYEDSKGRMWISTYGGGLNYFNRATEKFIHYTRKNGLQSDVIYGVLEDKIGSLWISSDNGIFRFFPEGEKFSHFDPEDGLQSQEFSGGAYFKSFDGEFFFGGINGLNHFYPDSIVQNKNIPPLVISSIKIAGDLFRGEQEEFELPYHQNFLTFEFAALDYTSPGDNHYEYMLEGQDPKWQSVDARYRIANYTNLAPGTYYFKVRGSNNDDVWNNNAAVIKIIILSPFWKTWWFIAAVVMLAALTIYFLSTIRIRNLLAIEKLKTKLAADLHDNIGAGLTEISILSELAANDLSNLTGQYSGNLKKISEAARHLIDNMSDIVWVVNPKRDSLHDLIIRLKDSYSDLLSGLDISLKTFNIEKIEDVRLPMEYKQNLFLILKEGLNNSIKHSRCKKITLQANVRNDIIEISLHDDGSGFNLSNVSRGNGLKNIESRAAAMGAKVKWRSSPENGTTLHFIGRITRNISLPDFRNIWKVQN